MNKIKRLLITVCGVLFLVCSVFAIVACKPTKTTAAFSVTAQFNEAQGSVTLSGATEEDGKYLEGTQVTVTVTAKSGYEVDTFTVNGAAQALTGGKYTFAVTQDTVVKATFKSTGTTPPVTTYTITIENYEKSQGSVTLSPEKPEYDKGDKVTLTVKANTGYAIDRVMVGTSDVTSQLGADGTYQITVTESVTVTVTFKSTTTPATKYTVTIASYETSQGSVTLNPEKSEYAENEQVTLTVTANTGYAIDKVMVGSSDVASQLGADGTYTITVTENITITVTFKSVGGEEHTHDAFPQAFHGAWTMGDDSLGGYKIVIAANSIEVSMGGEPADFTYDSVLVSMGGESSFTCTLHMGGSDYDIGLVGQDNLLQMTEYEEDEEGIPVPVLCYNFLKEGHDYPPMPAMYDGTWNCDEFGWGPIVIADGTITFNEEEVGTVIYASDDEGYPVCDVLFNPMAYCNLIFNLEAGTLSMTGYGEEEMLTFTKDGGVTPQEPIELPADWNGTYKTLDGVEPAYTIVVANGEMEINSTPVDVYGDEWSNWTTYNGEELYLTLVGNVLKAGSSNLLKQNATAPVIPDVFLGVWTYDDPDEVGSEPLPDVTISETELKRGDDVCIVYFVVETEDTIRLQYLRPDGEDGEYVFDLASLGTGLPTMQYGFYVLKSYIFPKSYQAGWTTSGLMAAYAFSANSVTNSLDEPYTVKGGNPRTGYVIGSSRLRLDPTGTFLIADTVAEDGTVTAGTMIYFKMGTGYDFPATDALPDGFKNTFWKEAGNEDAEPYFTVDANGKAYIAGNSNALGVYDKDEENNTLYLVGKSAGWFILTYTTDENGAIDSITLNNGVDAPASYDPYTPETITLDESYYGEWRVLSGTGTEEHPFTVAEKVTISISENGVTVNGNTITIEGGDEDAGYTWTVQSSISTYIHKLILVSPDLLVYVGDYGNSSFYVKAATFEMSTAKFPTTLAGNYLDSSSSHNLFTIGEDGSLEEWGDYDGNLVSIDEETKSFVLVFFGRTLLSDYYNGTYDETEKVLTLTSAIDGDVVTLKAAATMTASIATTRALLSFEADGEGGVKRTPASGIYGPYTITATATKLIMTASFTDTLAKNYCVDTVTVGKKAEDSDALTDTTVITANEDGTYTIDVKDGYTIVVTTKLKDVKVSFTLSNATVEVKAEDGTVLVAGEDGSYTVQATSNITFTIACEAGYGVLSVKVNGSERQPTDGVYTISDITSDTEVVVSVAADTGLSVPDAYWGTWNIVVINAFNTLNGSSAGGTVTVGERAIVLSIADGAQGSVSQLRASGLGYEGKLGEKSFTIEAAGDKFLHISVDSAHYLFTKKGSNLSGSDFVTDSYHGTWEDKFLNGDKTFMMQDGPHYGDPQIVEIVGGYDETIINQWILAADDDSAVYFVMVVSDGGESALRYGVAKFTDAAKTQVSVSIIKMDSSGVFSQTYTREMFTVSLNDEIRAGANVSLSAPANGVGYVNGERVTVTVSPKLGFLFGSVSFAGSPVKNGSMSGNVWTGTITVEKDGELSGIFYLGNDYRGTWKSVDERFTLTVAETAPTDGSVETYTLKDGGTDIPLTLSCTKLALVTADGTEYKFSFLDVDGATSVLTLTQGESVIFLTKGEGTASIDAKYYGNYSTDDGERILRIASSGITLDGTPGAVLAASSEEGIPTYAVLVGGTLYRLIDFGDGSLYLSDETGEGDMLYFTKDLFDVTYIGTWNSLDSTMTLEIDRKKITVKKNAEEVTSTYDAASKTLTMDGKGYKLNCASDAGKQAIFVSLTSKDDAIYFVAEGHADLTEEELAPIMGGYRDPNDMVQSNQLVISDELSYLTIADTSLPDGGAQYTLRVLGKTTDITTSYILLATNPEDGSVRLFDFTAWDEEGSSWILTEIGGTGLFVEWVKQPMGGL